jgi:hypothetical protein
MPEQGNRRARGLHAVSISSDSGELTVLLCRCAWHPQYHGYPLVSGVASWRGWSLRFTDGICQSCLTQFRTEHRSYLERRPEEPELVPPGEVA